MSRREIRESAMKLLFESCFRNDPIEELYKEAYDIEEITVNEAVREMVSGTLAHVQEIDDIIQSYSKKRALARIAKLNLTLLRLALYEILYDDKTPANAAISEAIRLARVYTDDQDVRFINGVLGAFSREHPELNQNSGSAEA